MLNWNASLHHPIYLNILTLCILESSSQIPRVPIRHVTVPHVTQRLPAQWIARLPLDRVSFPRGPGRPARPAICPAACCKAIFLWRSCSCVCPSRIRFAFACWPRPPHSCLAPHTTNNHSSNAQQPHLHDEPLSEKFGVVSANFSPIDASGELPSFNCLHSLDRLVLLVSNSLTYSPYNSMIEIGTLIHRVHAFLCFFVRVF